MPLRVKLDGRIANPGASPRHVEFAPWLDATGPDGTGNGESTFRGRHEASNSESFLSLSYDLMPSAGSHLIEWAWRIDALSAVLYARASRPVVMTVEELLRPVAANG